jgi:DNA-binding GntR family transcriptional regulator
MVHSRLIMCALRRPETLPEAVARHIRDAIVRGDYAPGAPLPEVRLADELRISRGTVREALRALEDQGLVDVIAHRGSFVSQVTRRTARDVYDVRAVLEAYAVRLTVERGWHESGGGEVVNERLDRLRSAAAAGDAMAMIEAERSLHRELWSHCGNDQLLAFMGTLQVQTRRLLMFNRVFSADPQDEVDVHERLVRTILDGDAAAAEAAIREHIRSAAAAVIARIPEEPQPEQAAAPAAAGNVGVVGPTA